MKKLPKGEKKIFVFFSISFIFSLFPYGKKQHHLLFPPFLSPEIGKPQGKTSHKFFIFFLTFLHPTAPRNRKNYHLPFFSKFRLKVPKTGAKGAQVSFFSNYLFSPRDYANTYTYPHTLRFPDPSCLKTAINIFFSKFLFFCSLLLLVTHETLPNHLFRQTNDQKW